MHVPKVFAGKSKKEKKMASVIGWYGPLIDLSKAALHVGDYVQLVVFVHRTTPLQYKLSKCGEVIRTDIQVGDETRPFFSVSLWQKPIASMAVAGDVVLLQNVKITKYGDVVEARTHHYSSLQCLLHPYDSILAKGVNDLIEECRVGIATKEKLRKVVEWVKKSNTTHEFHGCQLQEGQFSRNWKLPEERKQPKDCFSLSQLSRLPILARPSSMHPLLKFFCRLPCHLLLNVRALWFPLELDSENMFKQNGVALYCSESLNRLHVISLIYKPFMLYVWDESDYAPLLVRNKAAELLFGNIKAERVYSCYRGRKHAGEVDLKEIPTHNSKSIGQTKAAANKGVLVSCSSDVHKKSLETKGKHCFQENMTSMGFG
ncbi:hypothetical protein Prudu_004258 [Prunus dulcis]|uniref:Uncharacterized protein n=1 Tax=Prunus dulcis TaxID=3755 RepID=A0A4Y1QUW9_PRUDU|nr:hypothetical protein Prudu_004258 [Prunus dulcis]